MIYRYSSSIIDAISVGWSLVLQLLLLLLDLPHESLVEALLDRVHLLSTLLALLFHLLLSEESLRLLIDLFYLCLDPLVLILPDVPLFLPHLGLLVQVSLVLLLPLLLVCFHVLQRLDHLLLLFFKLLVLHFLLTPQFHFSVFHVLLNHFILLLLDVVELLEHTVGHSIHEVLSALLSGSDLIESILLLLVKHPSVCFLGSYILLALLLFLDLGHLLVLLVLQEHLLEVLLLLSLFLILYDSFILHFLLESLEPGDLSLQVLSGFLASLVLHLLELCVTRNLLLQKLLLDGSGLLLLALLQQLQVSLLGLIVLLVLLDLSQSLGFFGLFLAVELKLHEPPPLSFSGSSLFLLLVVEKSIELLNGSPLVFLLEIRI